MFRATTLRLANRMSDLIDDMLVGDFDYIADGDEVYADVDYYRMTRECGARMRPAAEHVDRDRRPGTVPPAPAVCSSPVRPLA
jgi:hypothetical protein